MQTLIATGSRPSFEEGSSRVFLIAAIGSVLAASLFYNGLPLMLLVGLPLSVYFSVRPFELLVFTGFMIPFNFVFVVGGIPVAAELLKVLLWVPMVLQLVARKQFALSRYHLPLLVIFTLLAYSCVVAGNLPFVLKESVRMGSSAALCYVAVNLVDTKRKLFVVLKSIAIASFVVGVYSLYQFAIQDFGALFWLVNPRMATALSPTRDLVSEWRNRVPSLLSGEMEAGEYFDYCLPLVLALFLRADDRRGRFFWASTVGLLFVGLLLTFTFGAWTAFAVALLCLGARFRDKLPLRHALVALLLLLSAGGAFIAANFETMTGRIAQIAFDVSTRWEFWLLAWTEFRSHPVIGGGLGSFGPLAAASNFEWLERISPGWSSTTSPHNAYIYILSQFGIVGFVCIFGIFAHAFRCMVRIGRRASDEFRWIALGLAATLASALAGSFTDDTTVFGPHCSSLIWLVIGLTEVVDRLSASALAAPPHQTVAR